MYKFTTYEINSPYIQNFSGFLIENYATFLTVYFHYRYNDFDKLDNIFNELYGESDNYLFDEIQNIDGWKMFVRQKLDLNKKFLITGSSASLLSRELGTKLTCRHINMELFPFSFREFITMKNLNANKNSFNEYLNSGGFPGYLKYNRDDILRELFLDIIERDIVARYKLRDSKVLKTLALYLLTNTGNEFSYNKIKNMFDVSINTIISFINYLEDSYILFTIQKFDYSFKKTVINP